MEAMNLVKNVIVFSYAALAVVSVIVNILRLFTSLGGDHGTGEQRNAAIFQIIGGAAALVVAGLMAAFIPDPQFSTADPFTTVVEVIRWLLTTAGAVYMGFGTIKLLTISDSHGTGEQRNAAMLQALGGGALIAITNVIVAMIPTISFL